jgi:glycosyltransferase involved in cell wall biosynthesis
VTRTLPDTANLPAVTPHAAPLRLGIDARCLLVQRTGVERFAYRVIDHLARLRNEVTCVLFVDQPVRGAPWDAWPHTTVVVPSRLRRLRPLFDFWLTLELPPHLRAHGLDAFFAPHHRFPFTRIPRFGSVHGLEWWRVPRDYARRERLKQWFWFQLSARFATGLVTFAHNSVADMRRLYPRMRVPVCVIPEGVDPDLRRLAPGERSAAVLEAHGIRTPFVLSVCSLVPRKNLPALLRAFADVVARHGVPHQLVLVGRAGPGSAALHELARSLNLTGRVVFTGYISDDELVQLYNQAAVFVYPSKYEGFGLPVIEAMACGTPVVTSAGSALREVAGNAAVLVNPAAQASIADGLAHVLLDPELRARLAAAGAARARQFDWLATARGILDFIRQQVAARQAAPGRGAARSDMPPTGGE